ncbi:MAG: preprotein translocase subunit YajC [Bacteroidales bacterium]|nr:preprotein translocase subunit YajC [Bacteroidales bacterium]MBQ3845461.1 preprotein translocase subunit YajC [Bacteroidales bacterium]
MNTLGILLQAAQPQQQGGGYSGLIMIAAIFVIFWLFFIRPQNKKQKEMQKFRDALQKGDKVITVGGIHGKVEEVKTTTVMISIDNNVKIEVEKSSLVANPNQVGQN